MFTFDSKHTRIGYKIRAQEQEETFGVVNRRQFGGNLISFHSQAPHVQGHFEIWKQVFTLYPRIGHLVCSSFPEFLNQAVLGGLSQRGQIPP